MPKRGNNHGATPCSNTDDRAVQQAFLQLGHVLAEIANSLQEKEAEVAEPKSDKSFTGGDGTSPKE